MAYQLRDVSADDLGPYKTYLSRMRKSNLFHSPPWLDFIVREHSGRLLLLEIRRSGEFYGYWPFITVRKLGFGLLGSPLRGWLTAHMGPLLEGPLEEDLIEALKRLCAQNRIAYLEVAGNSLDASILAVTGFAVNQRDTWVLEIEANEQAQWDKLHHNCRKNIKKAQRSDVVVSEIQGTQFFPRLYELVVRTFKKKGLPVPYGYRRLELLQDTIGASGQMLFLGAFLRDEFVGGHIWGHDHHAAYALVVGHDEQHDPLRVTNVLVWEGIKRFVRMGLQQYDMYGGSKSMDGVTRFKASFGSNYLSVPYYSLALSPLFGTAMFAYEHWYLPSVSALRGRRARRRMPTQ